jgi:hypothetical protein
MPDERYSKAALHAMYNQGKGILSPLRFSQKQTTYQWIGFGIGAIGSTICLMLMGFKLNGWLEYLALSGSAVIGVVCALIAGSVFEANFVCDETLQDPLFPSRR